MKKGRLSGRPFSCFMEDHQALLAVVFLAAGLRAGAFLAAGFAAVFLAAGLRAGTFLADGLASADFIRAFTLDSVPDAAEGRRG